MKKERTSKFIDDFLFALYLVFLVSIVFSFRALSSTSIGLILIAGIIKDPTLKSLFRNKNFLLLLVGFILLYTIQCISLFYTNNVSEGLKLLQRSSGLVFIPLTVFCSSSFLTKKRFHKIMSYFSLILCIAGLYCLFISGINYFSGAPIYTFFYHDLVKPISQHAIQFSIMVFIALLFLVENLDDANHDTSRSLLFSMIAFLSLFLVLLSSKLIISFYIIYLLCFFFFKQLYRTKALALILVFTAAVITIVVTSNPVGNRFRSILAGNSMLFEQKKFDPGIYFNGVQFRLLEWRFTYEILKEQKAWIFGLTPGDAQSFLDKKYIETDMYIGVPGTNNHGFIGYHTHNQFLQSIFENGLAGLILFLFICYSLFRIADQSKKKEIKWLVALLIIYCFTDAPFETQYGIFIFTFFPAFLCAGYQNSIQSAKDFIPYYKLISKQAVAKQPN